MKPVCAALLMLLFLVSSCLKEKQGDADPLRVHVGDALPFFTVVTLSGDTVSRDSLIGNPSVIIFFSTQCSDCQRVLPQLQREYERRQGSGVRFLCISRAETADVVKPFWTEHNLTMPCSPQPDRRIYELFATVGVPRIFVSDSTGTVCRTYDDTFSLN